MKEYKAVIYQENALSSLLFGTAKIDPVRFSAFLNTNAKQGWRVVTMEKDVRRMFLFWKLLWPARGGNGATGAG